MNDYIKILLILPRQVFQALHQDLDPLVHLCSRVGPALERLRICVHDKLERGGVLSL
jgi:hypothetical protein